MAFGTFDDGEEHGALAEINMVPLIDVMLVLLIIFLVTAPLMTHALRVNLPQANSAPATLTPELVTLVVDADGALYWNLEKISREQLQQRLQQTVASAPDTPLRLRADRAASWDQIAPVFALASQSGLAKLGVETEPDRAP